MHLSLIVLLVTVATRTVRAVDPENVPLSPMAKLVTEMVSITHELLNDKRLGATGVYNSLEMRTRLYDMIVFARCLALIFSGEPITESSVAVQPHKRKTADEVRASLLETLNCHYNVQNDDAKRLCSYKLAMGALILNLPNLANQELGQLPNSRDNALRDDWKRRHGTEVQEVREFGPEVPQIRYWLAARNRNGVVARPLSGYRI
jgi:hypothetical protein